MIYELQKHSTSLILACMKILPVGKHVLRIFGIASFLVLAAIGILFVKLNKIEDHSQNVDSQLHELQESVYFAQANIELMRINIATFSLNETADCSQLEWIWDSDVRSLEILLQKMVHEGHESTAKIFIGMLEGMQHRFIAKCGIGFNLLN